MSDFENIAYHQNGPIAVIILNRPTVMNALSPKMVTELNQAIKEVADDADVEALGKVKKIISQLG